MRRRKPFAVYLLYVLIFFLMISGLFGGINLMLDPTGHTMEMPVSLLEGSPFENYRIPGLLLFFFNGVFPLTSFIGLVLGPEWKLTNALNIYRNRHWSWTFCIYNAIILILWIDLQVMMIGYDHIIQTLYALVGLAILVVALIPSVMMHFEKDRY
ncbi:MAG: hypothetical protein K9I94_13425 [Bacteroidales bacterium]|nr:hypothetical protein [Bacteroidales bacterium]